VVQDERRAALGAAAEDVEEAAGPDFEGFRASGHEEEFTFAQK